MKVVRQISRLFILLMALSFFASGLAIWSFHTSADHVAKVSLAYQVYSHILSLKSNTYQLFKQFGDALTIGDLDRGEGEANLIGKIRADIRAIRETIGQEFEYQGEEEIDELEHLAKIELMVEDLISRLETIRLSAPQGGGELSWIELRRLLDKDIDEDFHSLIIEALEEERREVDETLVEAAEEAILYRWAATGLALMALMLTVASVLILQRSVGRPVKSLLDVLRGFSEGDRDRRVAVSGVGELREVAETFNNMADQIVAQTSTLSSENEALEKAVSNRTQKLENLIEDLKQAEESRKRMLADVSHELRTPLTIIQGEADIALRGDAKPAEVYREALIRARDAAKHTAHLVDDLLFVARNETGHARLSIADMNLVETAKDALSSFAGDTEFIADVDAAPMRGDQARIQQALLTLLENARHHGGNEVCLRISRTPEGFRAAVEDDGPGMTDAEKSKAFERFFRGSNAASQYKDGLGLGLPIAQSIANAHGGSLELADRLGGGLIAAMTLPLRPSLRAVA